MQSLLFYQYSHSSTGTQKDSAPPSLPL
nr:unnamed protein product [Callosobruchus chinensis]